MPIREYAGAARRTALVGDITAASTTLTVADATGYPTGATGPFAIALELGVAAEEKVLIASRSGNTLTVSQRGYDGTTAAAHSGGSNVDHVLTATDIREANVHVNAVHADAALLVSKAGGDTITASAASVIPLTVKGATGQTANLLNAVDSTGTVLLNVTSNGRLLVGPTGGIPNVASSLAVVPLSASHNALFVRGAAGQTANTVEVQDSAGTVLLRVRSSGNLGIGHPGSDTTGLTVQTRAATNVGLQVYGSAAQSGNLAEFGNSSGTVLFSILAGGQPNFAAPVVTGATAGGGIATPATVAGFLDVQVQGVFRRVPFYNA